MSNRYATIYNEAFSNYAEREIKKTNATQRAALSEQEAKILVSDSTIRRFCHDAPMEQVDYILTKLGKKWDKRYYDEQEDADHLEFTLVNQFQFPERRIECIEVMAKNNIHYLSSSDVALSAHMAAQNCMSRVYELSTGSTTAIDKLRNWSKLREPYCETIGKARDAADDEVRYMITQLNALDWAKKTLDLELNELRILGSLFERKDGAMTVKELLARTGMGGKKTAFNKFMVSMAEKKLLMNDGRHGVKLRQHTLYYMITSEGIGKIMDYRNYVHKISWNL